MKKGYWVVAYRAVRDESALKEYGKLAIPAIEAGGGRVLIRTSEIHPREAGMNERLAVMEFESRERAIDGSRSKHSMKETAWRIRVCGRLAEDREQNIWIGTYGGGLFRYDGAFTQFTMEQGLASRIVFQITVARDNSLISTPDGLRHMKGGRIRNFTGTR